MKFSSWGNREKFQVEVCKAANAFERKDRRYIPVGNLRSYGDQALSPNSIYIISKDRNRVLEFDREEGRIKVEAGMLLKEVQNYARVGGWMLPVLPGTQLVTIGGSIANDVHGKNHHQMGSFGEWVEEINILRSDSGHQRLTRSSNSELFFATIGGCGLTGLIVDATIQLVPDKGNVVLEERISFDGIEHFLALSQSSLDWESSVGWLNLFEDQKGIFLRGRRIRKEKQRNCDSNLAFPVWKGPTLINNFSSRLISKAYFQYMDSNSLAEVEERKHYFPLDRISNWNRAYGAKGFHQYQFVLPVKATTEGIGNILKCIKNHKQGSFLTVIKVFGDRLSGGLLSFPMPGITVAVDFPDYGAKTESMLGELDFLVSELGGRIYLAKDSRMSREMFESTYVNSSRFSTFRDPNISSKLSHRLMGY